MASLYSKPRKRHRTSARMVTSIGDECASSQLDGCTLSAHRMHVLYILYAASDRAALSQKLHMLVRTAVWSSDEEVR